MTPEILFKRLKTLAYDVAKLCSDLPPGTLSKVIVFQLLKSSFSAAANYRACCKGQSFKAFKSKLSIAFEESDETHFWLEAVQDLNLVSIGRIKPMVTEANELASILGKSRKTAERKKKPKTEPPNESEEKSEPPTPDDKS